MATFTKIPKGGSSVDQQSEEVDYQRETEQEDISLESVHIDRDGNGWKVTVIHDRNGRPLKQVEKFSTYAEVHDWIKEDTGKEEEPGNESKPVNLKERGH